MEKLICDFLERYKSDRSRLIGQIYQEKKWVKRLFFGGIRPSEESFVAAEIRLHTTSVENLMTYHKEKGFSLGDWIGVSLFLKNKAERLAYQVDFLNFFHTFLAIAFAVFVIAADKIGAQNWLLVACIGGFITKIFLDRSNLRAELAVYREFGNLVDAHMKKLG